MSGLHVDMGSWVHEFMGQILGQPMMCIEDSKQMSDGKL